MKNILYLLILLNFTACEKTPLTCDISNEKTIKTVPLGEFEKLEVGPLIELTIFQSNENKLEIKTAKDIMENITYSIEGDKLNLYNQTDCLVQNAKAVAYINLYVKNLSQIIANTDLDIHSGNLLEFDSLEIICENYVTGTNNIADFDLTVNINQLKIIANGSSVFNISGKCQYLFVGFYGLNPSIKGRDLKARKIQIYHRSNSDMHLFPVEEIYGDLFGYGDVYLYNHPPVVNITQHYAGHIYFVD